MADEAKIDKIKDELKKSSGIIAEFKQFISRGNVLDMAVGIIIGTAFTAIVTSLVNDIIMPIVGIFIGGINFSALRITIKDATICYGAFFQAIINFLIIAVCVFTIIKAINRIAKKKEEKPKAEPKPSDEVLLLTEIRDLLKTQNKE
jgi:large conductance mechanosensitive channel